METPALSLAAARPCRILSLRQQAPHDAGSVHEPVNALLQIRQPDVPQENLYPPDIVKEAHASLVEQLSLLYVTLTETLTTQQLCYLNALLAGETAITSAGTMNRYGISSSTSASRSKAALIKGDVLDNEAGKLSFQDPIYVWWLKHCYFR